MFTLHIQGVKKKWKRFLISYIAPTRRAAIHLKYLQLFGNGVPGMVFWVYRIARSHTVPTKLSEYVGCGTIWVKFLDKWSRTLKTVWYGILKNY